MQTKKNRILRHLETGEPLTQKEAYEKYFSFRLSAVIFELVEEGNNIINVQDLEAYPEDAHYSIAGEPRKKTNYAEYIMLFKKEVKKDKENLFD